jgi:hypothetical protein
MNIFLSSAILWLAVLIERFGESTLPVTISRLPRRNFLQNNRHGFPGDNYMKIPHSTL